MKPKFTLPDTLWAGDQETYLMAQQAFEAATLQAFSSAGQAQQEDEGSHLLSTHGDVGILTIRGSLTNNDSPYYKYYASQITSYPEIRRALVQAAHDSSIKSLLLDIESGGGAVAGLSDTANLLAQVGQLKDVYAFTGSAMASAAYWLGSTAGQVFLGETALMGSIGVLSTHMEYSKQLADNGVGVTVIRAGKFKALVNEVEPLTEAARKQLQERADSAYQIFVSHVATQRGVSYDTADTTMAQGREFFGAQAVTAGLADGVATFDRLLSRIQAKVSQTA